MPRIPDHDITRLKQKVSLVDLAAEAGVTLTGSGHNLIGHCPFHDDKTPSFIVDPVKNVWNCLGKCQTGGSNVDFVMRLNAVGFRDACQYLAEKAGVVLPEAAPAVPRLPNPLSYDVQGDVLLGQVADFYHQTLVGDSLAAGSSALKYLAARKINNTEMLRHFRLGFADRSLGVRLPDKNRRAGAEQRLRLTNLGVLKTSGHELFTGAITVPLTDVAGNTVGLYGRMITPNLRPGTPLHRYLSGPHRCAFNSVGAVSDDGEIIICEAIIDALTLWAHGIKHVTAACGINGFTDYHRTLCTQSAVKTVFIAYDNDEAGNLAAGKLADELMAAGKSVYRICVPAAHKDINGLACASDDAATELGKIIQDAEFLGGTPRQSCELRATCCELESRDHQAVSSLAAKQEIVETATNHVSTEHEAEELPLVITDTDDENGINNDPPSVNSQLAARSSQFQPDGDDYRATFGERHYRIRSLLKNADLSVLKIGLRLTVGDVFHQDALDLCQAKQRAAFISAAAEITKTDVAALKTDIAKLLDAGETTWLSAKNNVPEKTKKPTMTAEQREAALVFLKDPQLLQRIADDYETCGLVGDPAPKLVSYLCAISRKLPQPLAVLTMAPSAAGKSSLQDATLAFVPEEDALVLSTLTGQALYYSDTDLRHKVLAIAEEEGASRASYALKLLQSDGKLSLAVPIKDGDSGQISTQIKTVHGPVALFLTTTAPQVDDELANRCIVLTVDDSAEHTARVHVAQRERETLDGLRQRTVTGNIRERHHHAQRLLDNVAIVNPFAPALTFRCDRARTRRDHMKYLALIRSVTFLHQYQRPVKTTNVNGATVSYIETTITDIEAANHLAAAVLGRSLDELAPQTRNLLAQIYAFVSAKATQEARAREAIQFTRREIREATGTSINQVRDHIARLVEMEYVVPVRAQGSGMRQTYYLLYDGQGANGESFLLGLTQSTDLQRKMNEHNHGTTATWSPPSPHLVPGVWSAKSQENSDKISANRADYQISADHGVNSEKINGVHRSRSHTINGHAVLGGVS